MLHNNTNSTTTFFTNSTTNTTMYPLKFTVTTAWAEVLKTLDTATRCEIYDAIFEYAATGELPRLTRESAAAFGFIKMDLDRERERVNKIVERNRLNGLKGGRPPKSPATVAAPTIFD